MRGICSFSYDFPKHMLLTIVKGWILELATFGETE